MTGSSTGGSSSTGRSDVSSVGGSSMVEGSSLIGSGPSPSVGRGGSSPDSRAVEPSSPDGGSS